MALMRLVARPVRRLSSIATSTGDTGLQYQPQDPAATTEGWLFVDSVFPIQLGRWDLRHYIGLIRSPTVLSELQERLNKVTSHNFRVLSVEPQTKDGGVFVKFDYTPTPGETYESFEQALRDQIHEQGSLPSWIGLSRGNIWLVRGTPWREDLNRFASPVLKISFEGPDVHEQKLYQLLRPFGRINDVGTPVAAPAGTARFTTLIFSRLHSAAIARNVMHGLHVDNTLIRLNYQRPIQAHVIRDWMSSHPKITLPLIAFILGALTYTIFDPVRSFMVQGKLEQSFDYQNYRIYQWLRKYTINYLQFDTSKSRTTPSPDAVSALEEGWKERHDAESAIKTYLNDIPSTIAFVNGPQGSGKSSMVNRILSEAGRTTLVIDVRELLKGSADSQILSSLASQTGYWPVFSFLNSINSLIDLATVGLIGQKTGMVHSLPDQVQQILSVVGNALRSVCITHHHNSEKRVHREEKAKEAAKEEERRRRMMKTGKWHDGRLDCVSGNGVISELGVGDEAWEGDGIELEKAISHYKSQQEEMQAAEKARDRKRGTESEAVTALPTVVIRNFHSRTTGGMELTANANSREEVLNVLANWAGTLVENGVAHVIVVSDYKENAKRLTKALVSKPLISIPFYDADPASSLAFVKHKLHDQGVNTSFTGDEVRYLQRLGGRASDLESVIHKIRNGQTVEDAVEDIIMRTVSELRKSAFGDDADDARGRPWTKEQAWKVVKALSSKPEVSYYDILLDFPFKGDDNVLRKMEDAELITVGTHEGRPSTIRPGKPVYLCAFERLVNDQVFRATQEIWFNEKQIVSMESAIQKYEEELRWLKEVEGLRSGWFNWGRGGRAVRERGNVVMRKLGEVTRKVEELERTNRRLKTLIRGL